MLFRRYPTLTHHNYENNDGAHAISIVSFLVFCFVCVQLWTCQFWTSYKPPSNVYWKSVICCQLIRKIKVNNKCRSSLPFWDRVLLRRVSNSVEKRTRSWNKDQKISGFTWALCPWILSICTRFPSCCWPHVLFIVFAHPTQVGDWEWLYKRLNSCSSNISVALTKKHCVEYQLRTCFHVNAWVEGQLLTWKHVNGVVLGWHRFN